MTTLTRGAAQAAAAAARGLSSASWRALGTSVQVVSAGGDAAAARQAVEKTLSEVDLAVSRFRPDSELSRIRPGQWAPVSPLLHRYLSAALAAATWTDGLVDPTVGPSLVSLGYDRTFRAVQADGPALTVAVRPAVGWSKVQLEEDRVLIPRGTFLDLGATAKGLAADLAAASAAAFAGSVLVSLGGDIAIAGEVPDGGWPVLVTDTADPDSADTSGCVVMLLGGGLATSGTRARSWRRGDQLLHHLIDPRSGAPATGPWRTVTVVAETCVLANTASTAAIVLGRDAPKWLQRNGFTARLVSESGSCVTTGDWPTDIHDEEAA